MRRGGCLLFGDGVICGYYWLQIVVFSHFRHAADVAGFPQAPLRRLGEVTRFLDGDKGCSDLLTGLELADATESDGDRPLDGGELDWSLVDLFSNIARRFRTPPALADITAEEGVS